MNAGIIARVNAHAEKRRLSRALIVEAACTEYLDKLDRIEKSYKNAEGDTQ